MIITRSLGQVDLETSNLPIIIIDTRLTEIRDEPKINADMQVIYNGTGNMNTIGDPLHYDSPIGIEFRGFTQTFFPKKAYGVETRLGDGENYNFPLLDFHRENDWVFHAPYTDKSLIRNMLAMEMGRSMGRYASRYCPFELILNGEYQGVYVLMEKIKRDSGRVNISTLKPEEITGDDLTGGYIIKLDTFSGGEDPRGWASKYPPAGGAPGIIEFRFHYPKRSDIVPEQAIYIREFLDLFEDALMAPDFRNEETGYERYMNVDSFIDYMIMMEASRNIDAYRLSTYFYKDKDSKGGKLTMGPIWDFDLAFGNMEYCNGSRITGFAFEYNSVCPGSDFWPTPFWWERLLQDFSFRNSLNKRWLELRQDQFSTESINNLIDSLANVVEPASVRNFEKWPILDQYVWPNNFVGGSFEEEINYIKGWLNDRMEFLDSQWNEVVTSTIDPEVNPMRIYPNPFEDKITVSHVTEVVQIEIYSPSGKELKSMLLNSSGVQTITLSLNPGIYFYKILDEDKKLIQSGKLIKN